MAEKIGPWGKVVLLGGAVAVWASGIGFSTYKSIEAGNNIDNDPTLATQELLYSASGDLTFHKSRGGTIGPNKPQAESALSESLGTVTDQEAIKTILKTLNQLKTKPNSDEASDFEQERQQIEELRNKLPGKQEYLGEFGKTQGYGSLAFGLGVGVPSIALVGFALRHRPKDEAETEPIPTQ
ncbi:MAG TPA: hypothetical protein VLE91_02890 [Candidatus Saccharimonadales bacterium]|nr:hypothetical protein [Candidatus Saccharimonadales bacterium]